MPVPAEVYRSLEQYDLRVLQALERLMRRYKWVPEDILKKATSLSESELEFRIGRVAGWGMITSSSVPYRGYQLLFTGYDTLALHTLVKKGCVQALGGLLGEGKEAVVYEGLGLGPVVLKFHRVGQRSFQTVRKNRSWMPEWQHFPWVFASTLSARREYEALSALQGEVSVPVAVGSSRNVVVMSEIEGLTLSQCRLDDPEEILSEVIEGVATAYQLGFIHGDLSEYNIMADGRKAWIIDWPQWVEPSHPEAEAILNRDIANLTGYFARKYGIRADAAEVCARVIG